eukprot:1159453-Pelagomonas_calceolata.AAC.5
MVVEDGAVPLAAATGCLRLVLLAGAAHGGHGPLQLGLELLLHLLFPSPQCAGWEVAVERGDQWAGWGVAAVMLNAADGIPFPQAIPRGWEFWPRLSD